MLCLMIKSGSIIAIPAAVLIFLLLPVASCGLLRLFPILRPLFLSMRPGSRLLTRCGPWPRPLFLQRRTSLLRRGLGWS